MQSVVPLSVLGIVVVNYGSHRLIADNLAALDLHSTDIYLVIVDNFTTFTERLAIEALSAELPCDVISLPTNVGFGAGVNIGLRRAEEAGCGAFLVLNPDVQFTNAVLDELHQHSLREPMSMVTPVLANPSGTIAFQGSQLMLDTGRIKRLQPPADPPPTGEVVSARGLRTGHRRAVAWLPATCLMLHRELLTRLGGFDEAFFLYWEDVDLSFRCVAAGGDLVIRHDLVVIHDEGGTQQRRNARALSARYYFWNCRNRLLFASRHLSRRQILQWLAHTPAESWQILLRGGRRQLLDSPKPLLATASGSLSGLMIGVRALVAQRPTHGSSVLR